MRWNDKVKQRDGMKCVVCGATKRLQVHHIKPTFLYPECRWDVDNGVTLCAACHQRQHCGTFSGVDLKPINGIDPDPEGRTKQYMEDRTQRRNERMAVYVVWGTNKENGEIVFKAAKAAKQTAKGYIAEAVYMRLKAEGYDCDINQFVSQWDKRKEDPE